jgi:peptidoglycan/xylan/chitin deacetylase (PgdA/CDA1 family)
MKKKYLLAIQVCKTNFKSLTTFLSLIVLLSLFWSTNSYSAVILQYHHVSDSTPRSTSVTKSELRTHLNWLLENNFEILPIPDLVERIKNKTLNENAKIASITFDDLSDSICENAWPILKELNIPFTLFINTSNVAKGKLDSIKNTNSCNWQHLKAMHATGLATIGNHSHTHPHMLDNLSLVSFFLGQKTNEYEIVHTQKIIDEKLGTQKKIFAYPYGEYNKQVEQLVEKLGFIGFGQQSGAIGKQSDLTELPRFPMSGQYANLDTIPDKLLSLPFPIQEANVSSNPTKEPPELTLFFSEKFPNKVQCYLGDGTKIETQQSESFVKTISQHPLQEGRVRYNCTASSKQAGRFFWYSQQWLYQQ